MATTDISRSLVRIRVAGSFLPIGVGPCGLMDKALPSGGRDCGFESRLGLLFWGGVGPLLPQERLHGAMATRRIPDPKIGGSIPSEVSSFFCCCSCWFDSFPLTTKKETPRPGIEPGSPA
jgi:hypothetical protein